MSKKIILLTIIFITGLIPLGYFNTPGTTQPLYMNDEIDNRISAVSTPKSSAAKVISVWNFTSTNKIDHVIISKDGSHIAAINSTHVILLNKSSNVPLWNYTLPSSSDPFHIDISYNGTYIAVQDGWCTYLFNNSQESPKKYMWFVMPGTEASRAVAISETGKYVIAAHAGRLYFLNNSYSSETNPLYLAEWYYSFPGPAFIDPQSVAISYDGTYIVAGCDDGFVYFFNKTKTNPKTYEWRFNATGDVDFVDIGYDYINDLYYIVAANDEKELYLLNNTFENPKTAVWNATLYANAKTIDISSDGTTVVASAYKYIYYFNNSYSPTKKKEMWNREVGETKPSVSINGNGKYIAAGTASERTLYLINDKNETLWSTPQHILATSISVLGDYIVGRGEAPDADKIYLYHHDIPIPAILRSGGGGGGGDDDDKEAVIPFGNYYLIFASIAIISLIIILKKKVFFNLK